MLPKGSFSITKLGTYAASVRANTEEAKHLLAKHVGAVYTKEWLTTYGKAYDFVEMNQHS